MIYVQVKLQSPEIRLLRWIKEIGSSRLVEMVTFSNVFGKTTYCCFLWIAVSIFVADGPRNGPRDGPRND